jgi:hypothetical protein
MLHPHLSGPEFAIRAIVRWWFFRFILGSTIALIFWAIIYVWAKDESEKPPSDDSSDSKLRTGKMRMKHKGVKLAQVSDVQLGTGDDDDDYHTQSSGWYIFAFLLWGGVIIAFDVLLIYCAIEYDKIAPPDAEEMMEDDKKSEKGKKK